MIVSGVNFSGVDKSQYNAVLERSKAKEKAANRLKYGIASGAVAGLSCYTINSMLNNPNTPFIKGIDRLGIKGSEILDNININDIYMKTVDGTKNVAGKVKGFLPNLPKNSFTNKISRLFLGAKTFVKKGFDKVKNFAAPVLDKVKGPVVNVLKNVKSKLATAVNKFAKLPGSYKAAALVGTLAVATILSLSSQKSYTDGVIDQKYEQMK